MDLFADEALFEGAADEQQQEEESSWREYTVVLIDSQPSMMEPCYLGESDETLSGLTWLEAAVKLTSTMMRSKALAGAEDETALVFFNTANRKGKEGVENVWVEQTMGPPDVERIRALKQFTQDDFLQRIGAGTETSRLTSLKNALWQAASILPDSRKTTTSKSGRKVAPTLCKVMVCTRDATPAASFAEDLPVVQHAKVIAAKGGHLQLVPLVAPDDKFDLKTFWNHLLDFGTPSPTNHRFFGGSSKPGEENGGEEDVAAEDADENEEGDETTYDDNPRIIRLQDMKNVVRMKTYRKRAITRLEWRLGPQGSGSGAGAAPVIGIKMFSTLQTSWPLKEKKIWLDAADNALLEVSRAQIDAQLGLNLADSNAAPQFYHPKGANPDIHFPRCFVSKEEINQVKHPLPKGMSLLGFKPISSLQHWHNYRESTFIYPDEVLVSGSMQAFAALLYAMSQRQHMAICLLVRSPSAEPRMVALLPQEETVNSEGAQETPPGMHMIYLPYSSDIRFPEKDKDFTGGIKCQPTEAQISAATTMMDALCLQGGFDSTAVPNPHLQRHYLVLESKALNEDDPGEAVDDDTKPDEDVFNSENTVAAIEAFKRSIIGEHGDMGPLQGQGTKRKAATGGGGSGGGGSRPAASASVDREQLQASVDALGIPELAASDNLKKLKVDELKMFLQLHGLSRTGKKDDLIARIKDKLGIDF